MKWEYSAVQTSDYPSPETLNELGDDGWEVVQIVPREGSLTIYLKRIKGQ